MTPSVGFLAHTNVDRKNWNKFFLSSIKKKKETTKLEMYIQINTL